MHGIIRLIGREIYGNHIASTKAEVPGVQGKHPKQGYPSTQAANEDIFL